MSYIKNPNCPLAEIVVLYDVTERRSLINPVAMISELRWSACCVFKTEHWPGVKSPTKKMKKLYDHLSNKFGDKTSLFWIAEPSMVGHNFYIHALVKIETPAESVKDSLLEACFLLNMPSLHQNTKLVAIRRFDPRKGANYYMEKHFRRCLLNKERFYDLRGLY
jgi:hypothetical protein